eukprot:scaffold848_cov247-Pinguiococcus_pyrenoidosus.AAC.3
MVVRLGLRRAEAFDGPRQAPALVLGEEVVEEADALLGRLLFELPHLAVILVVAHVEDAVDPLLHFDGKIEVARVERRSPPLRRRDSKKIEDAVLSQVHHGEGRPAALLDGILGKRRGERRLLRAVCLVKLLRPTDDAPFEVLADLRLFTVIVSARKWKMERHRAGLQIKGVHQGRVIRPDPRLHLKDTVGLGGLHAGEAHGPEVPPVLAIHRQVLVR